MKPSAELLSGRAVQRNDTGDRPLGSCRGLLAQLVEHFVYTEVVGGSSPPEPTAEAITGGPMNSRRHEPVRQHSVDYLPGTSGNPVAPFQRDHQPGQGPIRHDWVYLVPIGAVVAGGVIAFFVWGN